MELLAKIELSVVTYFNKKLHLRLSVCSYHHTYAFQSGSCAYLGVRNVRLLENLACFVFLKHPFLDSPFLPYYQRISIFFLRKSYFYDIFLIIYFYYRS